MSNKFRTVLFHYTCLEDVDALSFRPGEEAELYQYTRQAGPVRLTVWQADRAGMKEVPFDRPGDGWTRADTDRVFATATAPAPEPWTMKTVDYYWPHGPTDTEANYFVGLLTSVEDCDCKGLKLSFTGADGKHFTVEVPEDYNDLVEVLTKAWERAV